MKLYRTMVMTKNKYAAISIIVPCYNYGHFIADTLNSVLEQTYPDWECIIVDDGSVDNSREVVSAFISHDNRFTYIFQENKGLPAARNTGLRAAQGEFLQFLDADDLIEKRKLELQFGFLSDNPDIDIVYGSARYFTTEQPELRLYSMTGADHPWMPKLSGKGKPMIAALIKSNIMVVSAALVRRNVMTKCGVFDETLRFCEDHEYWLRCALSGMSFHYADSSEAWTLVRSHPASMSKNSLGMMQATLSILDAVKIKLHDADILQLLQKTIFDLRIEMLLEQMRRGRRVEGYLGIMRAAAGQRNCNAFLLGLLALVLGVQRAVTIRARYKNKNAVRAEPGS